MIQSDEPAFSELMEGICETYQRPHLEAAAVMIYIAALHDFSFNQVQMAIYAHIRKVKFVPRPSDIIDNIEGASEITTDQVIAAARAKKSPFGILCLVKIGTCDLNTSDPFALKARAQECIDMIPEWRKNFTDHELMMMAKYEVNPTNKFFGGKDEHANNPHLITRFNRLRRSDRFLYLTAPAVEPLPDSPPEDVEACRERMKELMGDVLDRKRKSK